VEEKVIMKLEKRRMLGICWDVDNDYLEETCGVTFNYKDVQIKVKGLD
jgi:hypothetical protein